MERKLFGIFTGWQLTILGCVALLAPGALYAAVTFTAVTVVDPNTGAQSFVDGARRLYVYDPIAGYRNLPANLVNVEWALFSSPGSTACQVFYTVPVGKALVVTSVNGAMTSIGSGQQSVFIDTASNCPGPDVAGTSVTSTGTTPFALDLAPGVTVPAGGMIAVYVANTETFGFVRGYLVPAPAVPIPHTASAVETHPPSDFDKTKLH